MKTKLVLLALAFLSADLLAQAPGIITYQGRITNGGTAFTGTGQFRFAIYRPGTPPTSLWSHDNSSVGAAMPVTAVSLPVTGGLFSVGLGDTTVAGMVIPIPAAIFTNAALRVRIWFSDGVVAPALIADHAITSTGYAFLAMNVPDASITSAKIAGGAVGSAQLADDITVSDLRLNQSGTETVTLDGSTGSGQGALFTLRNGVGASTFVLDSDTPTRGSTVSMLNSSGSTTVLLNSEGTGNAGSLSLRDDANRETVQLLASFGGGQGALLNLRNVLDGVAGTTLILDADDAGAGSITVRNKNATRTVLLDGDEGDGLGGVVQVFNNAGAVRAELDGQSATGGGELVLKDEDGTTTVFIEAAEGAGNGAQIALYKGAGGSPSIVLDADFGGEGRISTQVLEITAGSDFSENFGIRSDDAQPGMLVRIDAAHPGELAVASRAYDRAVAGVVSGAGGVRPGLRMGQRGSIADGAHPVALSGRVYCLVDAGHGAIEPGDLITTSDTPGHGMKVSDHGRAQGAIIGKAMTPLASGRGLVLVLVSLQ